MKDEQVPVHQLDHAEPIVVQHSDQDMTVLGRWLQRAMEQGPRFWLLLAGLAAAVVGVAALTSGVASTKPTGSQAWAELTQAKTVEDRIKIAEAHPNTPVAGWARLLSAQEEYSYGVDDLTTPGKKELAGPRLKKALELFQQVAKEAGKDSSQTLGGLFGAARTLEARNELPEAIEQYKLVVERFPGSPEAKQSASLIKALEEPLNQMFYKELYAYKPTAPTGTGALGGPGSLFPTDPGFGLGKPPKSFLPDNLTPPAGLDAPPPSTPTPGPTLETPKTETPKTEALKKDETPATAPAPATTPSPAPAPVDTPKPAEPKPEPATDPATKPK